ncbi:MAG: CvpA family protein [Verrucomicrobia bacterium]|nr:CvpA family protein [Verrucomicrobiota bacterium]
MIVLFEIVRGWRLGLMRELVGIMALLSACACVAIGGRAVLPLVRHVIRLPDMLLSIIAGVLLAAMVYAVITSLGVVLFRRTSQHESKTVRFAWGSSGALLGIFFGLFFVCLIFVGVRLIGSLAAAQLHSRPALTTATMQPVWNRPLQIKGRTRPPEAAPSALATSLAQMKSSIENSALGGVLQQIDPTPPRVYRTMETLGAVATNLPRAERFLSFPGAREIRENPKIVALRNDREIAGLISHGRILDLLQNQRVIDAMNDRALRERISNFDLERALDYALQTQ